MRVRQLLLVAALVAASATIAAAQADPAPGPASSGATRIPSSTTGSPRTGCGRWNVPSSGRSRFGNAPG